MPHRFNGYGLTTGSVVPSIREDRDGLDLALILNAADRDELEAQAEFAGFYNVFRPPRGQKVTVDTSPDEKNSVEYWPSEASIVEGGEFVWDSFEVDLQGSLSRVLAQARLQRKFGNLVKNGSFESGDFRKWKDDGGSETGAVTSIYLSSAGSYHKVYHAVLETAASVFEVGGINNPTFAVEPGQVYETSMAAFLNTGFNRDTADASSAFKFTLAYIDSAGNEFAWHTLEWTPSDPFNQWVHKTEKQPAVPAGAVKVRPRIEHYKTTGKVGADRASIRRVA